MKVDLTGKIKETQLPRAKALLPMFEAVVNSLQAIEDARALTGIQTPVIEVIVNREAMLTGHESDGEVERLGFHWIGPLSRRPIPRPVAVSIGREIAPAPRIQRGVAYKLWWVVVGFS
jgi:hypothetical protein